MSKNPRKPRKTASAEAVFNLTAFLSSGEPDDAPEQASQQASSEQPTHPSS